MSDITSTYKLGLRMGEMFVGEATVQFKYAGHGDIWLNTSVLAVSNVSVNGSEIGGLEGITYDRHKLTISADLLAIDATNELCFRYINTYSK